MIATPSPSPINRPIEPLSWDSLRFPNPTGYVNDFGEALADDIEGELEQQLSQFERDTRSEIAIVTIPDTQGATIEDYAAELFNQWGIGKKGENNGVLLLLALNERRVRIEVGAGMELYLTEAQAGIILDNQVLPDLRVDNFNLGLVKGAQGIMNQIIASGYSANKP